MGQGRHPRWHVPGLYFHSARASAPSHGGFWCALQAYYYYEVTVVEGAESGCAVCVGLGARAFPLHVMPGYVFSFSRTYQTLQVQIHETGPFRPYL